MRLLKALCLGAVPFVAAQASASGSSGLSATATEDSGLSTQTYASYTSTITFTSGNISSGAAATSSGAIATSGTLLVGTQIANTTNATSSGTAAMPFPTVNLQPCNGYPELCMRNYSNITFVGTHNSPFHILHNAASNQLYDVVQQLNDGVRMLQGQTHLVNGVVHFCHTSCDLLDAGPAVDYFANVAAWLANHRFEVVTILIGNGNFTDVETFVPPIENSGLRRFAYEPPQVPMALMDWPTLGELILHDKRAIIFMDYKANETAVPYILDEFSQMWETPFDPLNDSFPCTVQRPPDLGPKAARDRLYLLNQNLNTKVTLFGNEILIPNTMALNTTNAVSGPGSLGASTLGCEADWGRPPNFLLVDYYNYGNFPGSVFKAAAIANNLTYIPRDCCGNDDSLSIGSRLGRKGALLGTALLVVAAMAWL